MKRRNFIQIASMGTAYAFFGSASSVFISSCRKKSMMDMNMEGVPITVMEGNFDVALPVPPIVGNSVQLTAQQTTHSVFQSKYSAVLGYQSNAILGSTIKVNSGDAINALLQNNLPEPTNIHWHGLMIPAAASDAAAA